MGFAQFSLLVVCIVLSDNLGVAQNVADARDFQILNFLLIVSFRVLNNDAVLAEVALTVDRMRKLAKSKQTPTSDMV